jgi:hypothetical protein
MKIKLFPIDCFAVSIFKDDSIAVTSALGLHDHFHLLSFDSSLQMRH